MASGNRIIVRADASIQLGSGHVMRCLTLAERVAKHGANVSFLCRELPGHLCDLIESRGFRTIRLSPRESDADASEAILMEERPDWLIVDHYALDAPWESRMRPHAGKLMVIDDLANRHHDCDLLLDQNYYADMDSRYRGLVPDSCKLFLGPGHVLLRPEFIEARRAMAERTGAIRRILVFFGGSDSTGETGKALDAIARIGARELAIDVVVGTSNPDKERIRERCAAHPGTFFHCQIPNMAHVMAEADFAIGGGGTTTWERCFLGLPTAAIVLAQNQLEVIRAVAGVGALKNLGWHHEVTSGKILETLEWAVNTPRAVREMGIRAQSLMGNGVIEDNSLVRALCGEGEEE